MEPTQIIEPYSEYGTTQRVAIYHDGNNLMNYSGRVLVVDGRELYKEWRFSEDGEKDMIKFANRCGFEDIRSFFEHFKKLTNGKPFYGIIRYLDGFRWFEDGEIKPHELNGKMPDHVELAKFMHDTYEEAAKKEGWETQERTRVEFDALPEENKMTMIRTAAFVLKYIKEKVTKSFR